MNRGCENFREEVNFFLDNFCRLFGRFGGCCGSFH